MGQVGKKRKEQKMKPYQKEMLLEYVRYRFESFEYEMSVGLLTSEDVLTIAIEDFIVDFFINEGDLETSNKFINLISEEEYVD